MAADRGRNPHHRSRPATIDARRDQDAEEVQLMVPELAPSPTRCSPSLKLPIRPGVRVMDPRCPQRHAARQITASSCSPDCRVGTNTNPWMSEAHDKIVQPGDLVGIDTDANGYEGYVLNVSRTFLCGDEGTPAQKEAYRIAYDCVNGMRAMMKPGMTFAEFSHASPKLPPAYVAERLGTMVHQAGWRTKAGIPYPQDLHEEHPASV